ncbi:methionyl-tRNA formyltransferase [Alphaproteobacteria bacterium]|nr:methionyl-tRNA formyltransferase [Alphaproteobacteria bacterium]
MTKVVFFGTEYESAMALERLIEKKFDIVAVVTKPDSARGRGRKIDSPAVKKLAEKYSISVLQPEKLTPDVIASVAKQSSANTVGILVSYGKIIPQSVIDLFPHGIINIHPSLLPIYRGPSPVETAILNGGSETGVSIMSLSAGMDSGPVYIQERITLDGAETSPTLLEKLVNVGTKLLIDNFDEIISGGLKPTMQNESQATYCQMIKKSDGSLDPATMTAIECDRRIRAFIAYPKSRLNYRDTDIIVTSAQVVLEYSGENWPDIIKCAENTYLQLKEIVSPTSGKTMKISDYINGLR